MAEENILTETELKINIFALKEILDKIELNPVKNVLFFSLDDYYSYIEKYYGNKISLSNIMKIIEPYIPLTLCLDIKGRELLAEAVQSSDPKKINHIKNEFYKKAVFNFFSELKSSETETELDYIFNLCNNLRIMHK